MKNTKPTQTTAILPTLQNIDKAVIQSTEQAFAKLLPVQQIQNITDAELVINVAQSLDKRVGYAKAKAIQKVDLEKWYSLLGYKSVISWAQVRFGIAEIMIRNYLKSAEYITDNASATIFEVPNRTEFNDFSISAIAEAIIPSKLSVDEINGLLKSGKIRANMTPKQLRAELKKARATDEKATDEKATAEKVEKLETVKISFQPAKAVDYEVFKANKKIAQGAYILIVYNNEVTDVYHKVK